jgi:hypothetical protein
VKSVTCHNKKKAIIQMGNTIVQSPHSKHAIQEILNDFSKPSLPPSNTTQQQQQPQEEMSPEMRCVIKKVMASTFFKRLQEDEELRNGFARIMSDKERLKQTYLNTDWTVDKLWKFNKENMKKIKMLQQNVSNSDETDTTQENQYNIMNHIKQVMNLGGLSRDLESYDFQQHQHHGIIDLEQMNDDEEEEHVMKGIWLNDNPKLDKNLKVKLIITDTQDENVKNVRKLVSPLLSAVRFIPKYGLFHTCLVIGPYKLEWTNSGICTPRLISSELSLFAVDIDEIATVGEYNTAIDVVAEVVAKWNGTMEYAQNKSSAKNGNCQDFVEDMMSALGIDVKFSGAVQSYLKDMKTFGSCEMNFSMPDESFRKHFQIKEKSVTFKTHEELDRFVSNCIAKDIQFGRTIYVQEFQLLKSFDRALWMRHLDHIKRTRTEHTTFKPFTESGTEIDIVTCHEKQIEKCACPFGDPRINCSFLYEKSFDVSNQ